MKHDIGKTNNMTFTQAEAKITDYMDYYNNERCQKRLGNIPPAVYAKQLEKQTA